MNKKLIHSFLIASFFGVVWCVGEMGPGLWSVVNVQECEDPEQYPLEFTMEMKKFNRTHDSFDSAVCLEEDLDERFGMKAEVYKLCDGGYKFQQILEDSYACKFAEDKSKDNLVKLTELAGIPSDCPLPKGCHKIENFLINYEDLPEQCVYGEFLVYAYIMKEETKMSCVRLELECEEKETNCEF